MPRALEGESWLQAYRRYIHKQEAPDEYHLWIGLTMISAALKRHIWVDREAYKIYPNLYVFLIAKSASCRKSVAMELGLDILSLNEDVKIVHERTTLEGLMDVMKRAEVTPRGARPDGSVVLHADELSNLFGKASYITDLVSFLTAAYTAKAKLDFLTRNKGWARVRNPCPVVLAGTTPEQMGEIFPSIVLSSGFLGRVCMILAERGKKIANPKLRKELREPLAQDLYLISQLEGEIELTKECNDVFTDWYENELKGPASREQAAFHERIHDHTLKVAMLLSVAESDKMTITLNHFEMAREIVKGLETYLPDAVTYIGAEPKSDLSEAIFNTIKRNDPEPIAHSVLLRRFHKKVKDANEFNAMIDILTLEKHIEPVARQTGIFYKLKEKPNVPTPDS